jgi:hypothetical protein
MGGIVPYLASGRGGAPGGEPSEEAVVVDEPDSAAAGTGVAQRSLRLGREVADAARVLLLVRSTGGITRGHLRLRVGHGHGWPSALHFTLPCRKEGGSGGGLSRTSRNLQFY